MYSFQKITLASLIVVAGITVASAAPERALRDQSGVLYSQDQSGTWRPAEQQPRTPIARPQLRALPYTLEEDRAFERASQPTG
jgi:hypothetical protein